MDIPLAIVVALAENGVIGRNGTLPWRIRTDLRRFKALTMGRPLVMGRRNWDSIGRPLPGRETIVLTRDRGFAPPGAIVAHAWADAVAIARERAAAVGADEVAIVGGAEIYRLALPQAERMRLTRVHARPDGDVLFPTFDEADFVRTGQSFHPAGPEDEHPFTFVDLVRRPASRKP